MSRFFFFFLISDLYLLNPAAMAEIFDHIADLLIPIEIPIKEAKAGIEISAVIAEAKKRLLVLFFE